jgi:serine/threonine protein phosphatase PrpC
MGIGWKYFYLSTKKFPKNIPKFLKETQNNIINSLSMAFEQIDEDIKKQTEIENQGSTGKIIHIIRGKNKRLFVYNGNFGDSRVSLISSKK